MNNLKKAGVIFGMSVFSLLILCSAGQGLELKFGFKLIGGLNYQLLGDGDATLRGLNAQAHDYAEAYGSDVIERYIVPLASHFAYEFDADVILYLTPQFGVSLGTGYIRAGTLFGSGNQIVRIGSSGEETWTNDIVASSVPIKVGVYYTFSSMFNPTQGKSSSYLFGGIGLYTAKFSYSQKIAYLTDSYNYSFEAKASNIGVYAGFGGENWVNPNFAFVYELTGRYARIGGFKGDYQSDVNGLKNSGSGTVNYYEYYDPVIGNWYPDTWIFEEDLSDPNIKNVREAKIDFSGIGFNIGIKIVF